MESVFFPLYHTHAWFLYSAKVHEVPSMRDIGLISEKVGHKWRLIGMKLGVNLAELDQICIMHNEDQFRCCLELFMKWSAREITASCPFTWKGVIETLDSDSVRESSLARSLESTHL